MQTTVVDGDTVRYQSETVRLPGFDTPETRYANCDRERALGKNAEERLGELIGVRQGRDDPQQPADKYRRLLAVLTVDIHDVAAIMIREGLAAPHSGRSGKNDWCGLTGRR